MTSCHGGEAITSSSFSVDCWRTYSNLLGFPYFFLSGDWFREHGFVFIEERSL